MEERSPIEQTAGVPELTELGKRIEMLRIERGLSKQHLARHAGTSRQQLWRVMTGKSELTLGLRARLADVLQSPTLEPSSATTTTTVRAAAERAPITAVTRAVPRDLAAYVSDPSAIRRTLATLPRSRDGLALKRRLLDAVEDQALAARIALGREFFDLRRQVLAGEL